MSQPQDHGQESTGLLTIVCGTIAQRADRISGSQRTELQRAIIQAWSTLTRQLPSLERERLEQRAEHASMSGQPGLDALSYDAKQALSGMSHFAESPTTYVEQRDQGKIDDTVKQILPPIVTAMETAGITIPADAQRTYQQVTAGSQGGSGGRRGEGV